MPRSTISAASAASAPCTKPSERSSPSPTSPPASAGRSAERRPPALVDTRFAPPRAGHPRGGLSCADRRAARQFVRHGRQGDGVQRPALRAALAALAACRAEHRTGGGGCRSRRADFSRDARRRRPCLPPAGGDGRPGGRLHRSGAPLSARNAARRSPSAGRCARSGSATARHASSISARCESRLARTIM